MINNSDTTGKTIWFPFPFVRTEAYGARLQPTTGIGYRYYFGKASDFNGPLTDFKASKCFRAKKVKMSGKRKHVVSQKESYIAKRNGKNLIIEHREKNLIQAQIINKIIPLVCGTKMKQCVTLTQGFGNWLQQSLAD